MKHVADRLKAVHRVLRLRDLPFERGEGFTLVMPGYIALVGGPNGYGEDRLGDVAAMDRLRAANPHLVPMTIRHRTTPDDAVVSMSVRDWSVLMSALIASDPDRYMIQKEN